MDLLTIEPKAREDSSPGTDYVITGDPAAFFWLLSAAGNARDGLRGNWAEATDGSGDRLVLEPGSPQAQQIPRSPTGHLQRPARPTPAAAAQTADPLTGIPHREIPIDALDLDQARERLRHLEGRIGLGYITPAGEAIAETDDVAASTSTPVTPAPHDPGPGNAEAAPAGDHAGPTPATSPDLDRGAPPVDAAALTDPDQPPDRAPAS